MSSPLRDPLLEAEGVRHGFGVRGAPAPPGLARPRQVHGAAVCELGGAGDGADVEADAIVCRTPGVPVGVLTADCVPVLLAWRGGFAVAAVHAGWRGLAAGVVRAGVEALSRGMPEAAVAAIGPHVGPCCYEVDEPVLRAMRARFGPELPSGALRPGRSGHGWLDLGALVAADLRAAGLPVGAVSVATAACTSCDPERFHSYRRDGPRSGRLVHHVTAGREGSARPRAESRRP